MKPRTLALLATVAALSGLAGGWLAQPAPPPERTPHGLPWPAPMPPTDKTPAQRVNETFDVLRAHGYRPARREEPNR